MGHKKGQLKNAARIFELPFFGAPFFGAPFFGAPFFGAPESGFFLRRSNLATKARMQRITVLSISN